MKKASVKDNEVALFDTLSDAKLMHHILSIPKIELHRHLIGSISGRIAAKIAAKYNIKLPTYITSELEEILFGVRKVNTLPEYFTPWLTLEKFFVSAEIVREIIIEVAKEAVEDNVIYLELRMGPYGFLGKKSFTFEEFVHAISVGIKEAESKFGIIIRCILGVPRHIFAKISASTRNRMLARMISIIYPLYSDIFVGVDLNGDESVSTGEDFKVFFRIAREKGFGVTVHAGECGPWQNVEYAIKELKASRIGHGLAASKNPKLLSFIAENNIMLEICPTSNEILSLISRANELPLKLLTKYNVPFTICSDNPGRNRTLLSEDIFKVARSFNLSVSDLNKLMYSALDASFADEKTKKVVNSRLEEALRESTGFKRHEF